MEGIQELKKSGLSITAISEITGYDRKTVGKYLLGEAAVPNYGRGGVAEQAGRIQAVHG